MATFNKFNITAQDAFRAAWNTSTLMVGLKVMLSNTLPTATMTTSTDITDISTAGGGGYALGGQAVTITSSVQTSGAWRLLAGSTVANAIVFTSTTGTIGPFQYAILHGSTNVTSSTISGTTAPLLGWYDYGSAITLNATETFTITWDGTSGIIGCS